MSAALLLIAVGIGGAAIFADTSAPASLDADGDPVFDSLNTDPIDFGFGDSWDDTPVNNTTQPILPDAQTNLRAYIDALNSGEASGQWNVLVGGALFSDMSHHPAFTDATNTTRSSWAGMYNSHAAGGLQFQPATWAPIAKKLGLKDFSEASQRAAGIELIRETGDAYNNICIGAIAAANYELTDQWQSIITRGSDWYIAAFQSNGGVVTA